MRYRNLTAETIIMARFKRTYFGASRDVLGSDTLEDHAKRKPNKNDMPGKVPVAAGYWKCIQQENPYGAKVKSVLIVPTFVKFSSGKTWRLP